MKKEGYIFLLILVGLLALFIFLFNSPRFLPVDLSESKFCKDQGFHSDTLTNSYREYLGKDYGMVECVSCYVEKCIFVELNVTKDWRGNLHRVKGMGVVSK